MFDEMQSLKGSCAKTYEELEQMHAEVLLGKGAPMRKVWSSHTNYLNPDKKSITYTIQLFCKII